MEWLVGLIGVIIGAGIQEFRHWRESKERYQVMTFEKRLQVHQDAVSWCWKIAMNMTPGKLKDAEGIHRLLDDVKDATEWVAHNCLLLDYDSNNSMRSVLEFATETTRKYVNGEANALDKDRAIKEISKNVGKATRCIAQGVGVKYMPDIGERLKSW